MLPLVALMLAVPADASKPRLRLERIDASRFASDGTVRVFASVVELEGNIDDDKAAPMFVLTMDKKRVGAPVEMKQFQGAGEPLDLVLVVESSALYGPKKIVVPPPAPPPPRDKRGKKAAKAAPKGKGNKIAADVLKQLGPSDEPLDKVKDAVRSLLDGLPPRVRVMLIDYGADINPHPPFRPAPAVESDVDDLLPDGDAGDLTLGPALHEALKQLAATRTDGPARRLIVVVSDGLNSQMDRRTFRALGDAAAKAHVPIHTIAFSPQDERGPLLNLGEISKRSNGTFRWAKSADDLRAQIDTLADELNKQYVLTYKIDAHSLEGRTFQLACDDLTSNTLVYDSSGGAFGVAPATRPLLPWWAWAILGVLVFGGAAIVVARRRPKKVMRFSPYKQQGGAPSTTATQPQARPQAQPQSPSPSPPVVRAPTRGILIVVSGALAGQRVDVGAQPVLIGKGAEHGRGSEAGDPSARRHATLQISDDAAVSTRHCQVALAGGAFVVTDLGSTNGTFVNNQRIAQPTRLNDGDLLRCGNTQLKFRAD